MILRNFRLFILFVLILGGVGLGSNARGASEPLQTTSASIDLPPNGFFYPSHSVTSIATSPVLPNAMAVGFRQGSIPRISLSAGGIWFPVAAVPWTTNLDEIQGIAIAPRGDPANPLRILVSVTNGIQSETGIYRTGDFGQTWVKMDFPYPSKCNHPDLFNLLSASPVDPNRLFFSKSCYYFDGWNYWEDIGMGYSSQDAGFSFQLLQGGYENSFPGGLDLQPSPVIGTDVYNSTFQVSQNSGATWTNLTFPLGRLVLDGKTAQRMVVVDEKASAGSHSTDGGVTWHPWATFPCPNPAIQAAADPAFGDTFYLTCSEGLFRSQDGGDHWTQLSQWHGRWIGPDYSVSPPRILWARNDGLWASADAGTSWIHLTDSYQAQRRTSWENTSPADPVGEVRTIRAVDDDNAWAVTESGSILHWEGQSWERLQPAVSVPLTGLAFDGAQNGWAVGSEWAGGTGQALHWNGVTWQSTALPNGSPNLKAVDVIGSAAWAVGDGGVILQWDGSTWNTASSPITDTLTALDMVSPTQGWVGGGNFDDLTGTYHGVLAQRTAAGWAKNFTSSQYVITGISALAENDAWASAAMIGWSRGFILHWNGVSWQEVSQYNHDLYAISMASPTDGWAIGNRLLLHWNGVDWQQVSDISEVYYTRYASVSALPSGHTWFSLASGDYSNDSFTFRYTGPRFGCFLPLLNR